MTSIEIQLPKLGESIHSATVVRWLKKEGERIALDEAIVEVSTDKVNSEIPSPIAGTLEKILAPLDSEVFVGQPLARVLAASPATTAEEPPKRESSEMAPTSGAAGGFYSPAVLQLARLEGICLTELEKIPSSGQGGRLTRQDLEKYVTSKKQAIASPQLSSDTTQSVVKLTPLRKAIAASTARSHAEIPPAAIIHELDIHALMEAIQRQKQAFFARFGVKLTLTAFIAKAISEIVTDFPLLNARLEGDHILVRHSINLGIAVSVEHGVIIPVIKHCGRQTIPELAQNIAKIAQKTRENALTHEDLQDPTLSMSNFGMAGVRIGIPIVPFPQVAIFGIGAVQKRVLVLDEDKMAIRQAFDLSLSFDHRVLDGVYACEAVKRIQAVLDRYALLEIA